MKQEIYVTGSGGLVGSRFVELNSSKYDLLTPEVGELNILDRNALEKFFQKENLNFVVHFAAFTDVSEAENQRGDKRGACWQVNVEGTGNVAEMCRKYGVFMIHISTDMVFPGSGKNPGPYQEDHIVGDDPDKVTWYGYTKGQAEKAVMEILGEDVAILRIIYPVSANYSGKLDYLRKPLKLYREGKLYPLFNDQQVSVSFVDEVSGIIERIVDGKVVGIFHAASKNTGSPHEIVSYLIERVGGKKEDVISSKLSEYKGYIENPVRYPMFGGLKVEKTEKRLGVKFSTWQEIVDELVRRGIGSI